MSNKEILLTIVVLAVSVQLTRTLPFVLFRDNERLPSSVQYLGRVLPAAVMGLLCIYCFKDFDYSSFSGGFSALIAALAVILVHLWKNNTIASIAVGTAVYMILIRIF